MTLLPTPSVYGLELVRHDEEDFEMGFKPNISFISRRISGLVGGSRTTGAGIRGRDEIVGTHAMLWQVADDIAWNTRLKLGRDGDIFDVGYWPRLWETVRGRELAMA